MAQRGSVSLESSGECSDFRAVGDVQPGLQVVQRLAADFLGCGSVARRRHVVISGYLACITISIIDILITTAVHVDQSTK